MPKADARRAGPGRKVRRNRGQRGCAAPRTAAAAHHTGVGVGRLCARRILERSLGLRGGQGSRGRIGRSRIGDAGGSAKCLSAKSLSTKSLMVPLNMVTIRRVTMTDMGVGYDRRELNGDQEDRRPNYPQQCAGRGHAQLLAYGSSERNSGSNCGKCMVTPLTSDPTGRSRPSAPRSSRADRSCCRC